MSWLSENVLDPIGEGAQNLIDELRGKDEREEAQEELRRAQEESRRLIGEGTAAARGFLTGASQQAQDIIRGGTEAARGDIRAGIRQGQETLRGGLSDVRGTLGEARTQAQGFYGTPAVTETRAELLARVRGEGGYSPDVIEKMKAGARETYGVGLRDISQLLGQGGQAAGLTQQNLVAAAADLLGRRAAAERDVDIEAARLAEEQQTGAIPQIYEEARQRAGVEERFGIAEAQLQDATNRAIAEGDYKLAGILGELSQNETIAVANLANSLGVNLADLSTSETMALVDIALGGAVQRAENIRQPNYLGDAIRLLSGSEM